MDDFWYTPASESFSTHVCNETHIVLITLSIKYEKKLSYK